MKKCKNTDCNNIILNNNVYCSLRCRNIYVNKNLRDYSKNGKSLSKEKKYIDKEKKCKKCGNIIPYQKRRNNYCSHSCSVSESNKKRIVSEETKKKTKISILSFLQKNPDFNIKNKIKDLTIFIKCKGCNNDIEKSKKNKFCSSVCRKQFRRKNMTEYQKYKQDSLFKFSLNSYPNEFDFDLIKKYGWYKPTNRGNNLNGVSRDHLYSIMDGFENSVDTYLISHPANCKLILQKENSSKHKKSSITLDELKEKVIKWNKNTTMKILLDIDDTLINHKDELHPRYKEVIDNHEVILYSASADIKMWAKKLNLDYHSKNDKQDPPEADVLIDDCAAFYRICKVKHYFPSIDSFLTFINK